MVETSRPKSRQSTGRRTGRQSSPEVWVAISVIGAAALATFLALFLTSRPFDPANATIEAQQSVPAGPSLSPSPKSSPSSTPAQTPVAQGTPGTPGGQTAADPPTDTSIQTNIESTLAADPNLAKLDVSTLVENGKVTIVGSVKSEALKQRVEKAIQSVKGVTTVDNQLVIIAATP